MVLVSITIASYGIQVNKGKAPWSYLQLTQSL